MDRVREKSGDPRSVLVAGLSIRKDEETEGLYVVEEIFGGSDEDYFTPSPLYSKQGREKAQQIFSDPAARESKVHPTDLARE
jgi:hypothetical protein